MNTENSQNQGIRNLAYKLCKEVVKNSTLFDDIDHYVLEKHKIPTYSV